MNLQGDWMTPAFLENDYVVENCDVAVLPKDATTGKRVSLTNGLGWSVAANTDMPNAAKSLALYLGTPEAQQKQADEGITMSALKDTQYSETWQNAFKDTFPGIGAYITMLNEADLVPVPCSISTTAQWKDEIFVGLVPAFSGTQDTAEVCKTLAASMNARLAEE
jgi:multiple sugar transport system substrate-binding protein